ncbi:MAG: antitermination regulator, partial [Lachnospiraceae bacterium]|nr:antitermination regulator [Lachnospiraceae bacterium]
MATPIQTYSVLLVSAARKINTALMSFLPGERFDPVTVVDTAARARRTMAERDYDFIIINGPLPDEFGKKLA